MRRARISNATNWMPAIEREPRTRLAPPVPNSSLIKQLQNNVVNLGWLSEESSRCSRCSSRCSSWRFERITARMPAGGERSLRPRPQSHRLTYRSKLTSLTPGMVVRARDRLPLKEPAPLVDLLIRSLLNRHPHLSTLALANQSIECVHSQSVNVCLLRTGLPIHLARQSARRVCQWHSAAALYWRILFVEYHSSNG